MVNTSLAEFRTWDSFAGLLVWLFWLDWGSWVQMCICLSTSIFLSFVLESCVHPHPKPFTSLPSAAADGHHLCQEEPEVLITSIWPLNLELFVLTRAVVWPIPDSTMTAEHKLWMPRFRRKSNTSAGLEADSCPAVPWSLMSTDSSFWFLVCFVFVATLIAALVWCMLCQLYFFPLAAEKEQCMNAWEQQSWLFSHLSDTLFSFPKTDSRVLPPHSTPNCCLM